MPLLYAYNEVVTSCNPYCLLQSLLCVTCHQAALKTVGRFAKPICVDTHAELLALAIRQITVQSYHARSFVPQLAVVAQMQNRLLMVFRWWDTNHAGISSSNAAEERQSAGPTHSSSTSSRIDLSNTGSKALGVSSKPKTTRNPAVALTQPSDVPQGQSLGSQSSARARFRQVKADTGINQSRHAFFLLLFGLRHVLFKETDNPHWSAAFICNNGVLFLESSPAFTLEISPKSLPSADCNLE